MDEELEALLNEAQQHKTDAAFFDIEHYDKMREHTETLLHTLHTQIQQSGSDHTALSSGLNEVQSLLQEGVDVSLAFRDTEYVTVLDLVADALLVMSTQDMLNDENITYYQDDLDSAVSRLVYQACGIHLSPEVWIDSLRLLAPGAHILGSTTEPINDVIARCIQMKASYDQANRATFFVNALRRQSVDLAIDELLPGEFDEKENLRSSLSTYLLIHSVSYKQTGDTAIDDMESTVLSVDNETFTTLNRRAFELFLSHIDEV